MAGTLRSVCNYLRGLHDNIDFQLVQLKKTQESLGGKIETLEKAVSTLEGELRAAQEEISTLKTDYDKLATRVTKLENKA